MTVPSLDSSPSIRSLEVRLNSLIALVAVCCGLLFYVALGPKPMPHWEYKVAAPNDFELDRELNRLGREGWDIVAARRATSNSVFGASYELILKRPGGATGGTAGMSLGVPGDPKASSMASDLRNLVTAEESFFADNVTYTMRLGSLHYSQSPGNTVTIMSATGTGWSAIARNSGTTRTCGIYVGSATAPITGQLEGEPKCQ